MSHHSDPTEIELQGADVARRYRQLPVDTVPADIDELILREARDAVAAPAAPRGRYWSRWTVPLACAASALVAFALVYEAPKPITVPAPKTASVVAEPEVPAKVPTEAAVAVPAPAPVAALPTPRAPTPRPAATPPVDPPAPPEQVAAVAETLDEVIVTGSYIRGSAEDAALPVEVLDEDARDKLSSVGAAYNINGALGRRLGLEPTPAEQPPARDLEPPAAATVEIDVNPILVKDPELEKRLERIRELRVTGRGRSADSAWRRFRQRHPDYPVAADDIARPKAR